MGIAYSRNTGSAKALNEIHDNIPSGHDKILSINQSVNQSINQLMHAWCFVKYSKGGEQLSSLSHCTKTT
jgi:hypothetical protein